MPTISQFFGISVRMYYDDHPPPHFHIYYQEFAASVEIDTLVVIAGPFPRRAMALVLEWGFLHRPELVANWQLAETHRPLQLIEPLE